MFSRSSPFSEPVYVTRPILPRIEQVTEKLEEIWHSKWLTNNGPQHQLLEQRLCEYLGSSHLSLFNNGTIAMITACRSLRLSGEVITTPFTFPATPHVLNWNNIKPIFCDIDPFTMNIDAEKIESMITPETTGILGVHVFGIPCNVYKIQEISDRYGLKVVYDAAHAFGVNIDGQSIAKFGDISMMSFHATKLFHTIEGGALLFKDPNLKRRIDLLKNFGIKNEEEVVMPGINGKMNELQAAMGLILLNYIEDERRKRKVLIQTYRECLQDIPGITLMPELPNSTSSLQYFVIRIDEKVFGCSRNKLYEMYKAYNVFVRKYFYPLCSQFPCYKHLPSANPENLPIANSVAEQVLSMPLYGELSISDIEKICKIMLEIRDMQLRAVG